jgi:hypothetical protein
MEGILSDQVFVIRIADQLFVAPLHSGFQLEDTARDDRVHREGLFVSFMQKHLQRKPC